MSKTPKYRRERLSNDVSDPRCDRCYEMNSPLYELQWGTVNGYVGVYLCVHCHAELLDWIKKHKTVKQ